MKRLLCIVVLSSIFSLVKAQQTHFGIKAGVNLSSVGIDGGDDYNSKAGLHVGGLAHIHISRQFALQPELVFSMQGGKDDNVKLKLNYINVPLLAQYMTNDGFRLQTGPQLGFLVSAERKIGDVEVDVKDDLSTVDFSWAFGAGYLFSSGFGIDARYNLGISNISDDNSFEARNSVFQFGIFYQFMHGKSTARR
ncbi:MAG TPA: porin family protein [Chitinophagaceae bacterium]|nr:porin family protein [Chitinophagaceae bacterium]